MFWPIHLTLRSAQGMLRAIMNTEAPPLQWEITKENWQGAVTASSASCVHADAIKEQYPKYSAVRVNVATIQASDRARGVRYIYLTPSTVSDLLLAFDQGWPIEEQLPKKFRIKQPVQITPIARSVSDIKIKTERRAARLAELEAKQQSGELTSDDKRALKQLTNHKKSPTRPAVYGPSTTKIVGNDVIRIGKPSGSRTKFERVNANLLHERDRHFGSKSAQPSQVFKEAVQAAVKADRMEREKSSDQV